jgi:hypothetical protein
MNSPPIRERNRLPMELRHNRDTLIGGLAVSALTLIAYCMTMAPTVAFWDCGEYVTSMVSLGIPHPPGNPLFIIMGRVSCVLFAMFGDPGLRINLLVVLFCTATITFTYLIIVRVLTAVVGQPETGIRRLSIQVPAAAGALIAAFGYTFWFSAVEQSECNPSVFFIVLSTWLAIVWAQSKDPGRDRILILLAYINFLGVGLHMLAMLGAIPVFLFVVLVDRTKLTDWRLWITGALLGSVIYDVAKFLWIAPLVMVLALAFSLVKGMGAPRWRFCFWIAAFALMGYSVQLFIPIRSALNPTIDENHPVIQIDKSGKVEWGAFKGFLERKQYGSESMITRMFHRRGSWSKQLGIDGHMGYGGFHITQFFHFGRSIDTDRQKSVSLNYGKNGGTLRLLIYLLPTVLMLWAWVRLYRTHRSVAALLILLFLMGSPVMVLYMNFSDGYHCEKRDQIAWEQSGKQGSMPTVHREVRIRDYFFTPGFLFFGMWLGIAFGLLLQGAFYAKNQRVRAALAPLLLLLIAASPALPFSQNLRESNRWNDWVPFDYAYNLLMSCERDGILFTNGDNDTFPLWALQEGYGIRRDVRIINLSLVNTKWYIKQLKNLEPRVPISYSERQIDQLNYTVNPIAKTVPYTLPNTGLSILLQGRDERPALKIQDKMVLNIVDANQWRKPLYFAVTVSADNYMGLRPYLQMQGLAFRVLPDVVPQERQVDVDRTLFMLEHVYRFTGLGEGSVLMNETSSKLVLNYAAGFLQSALMTHDALLGQKAAIDSLARQAAGDGMLVQLTREYNDGVEKTARLLDQCVSLMPWDKRPEQLRQEFLIAHNRFDRALTAIRQARLIAPANTEYVKTEARILVLTGKRPDAAALLAEVAEYKKDPFEITTALVGFLLQADRLDDAITVMREFQAAHPGDRRAAGIISQLEARAIPESQSTGPSSPTRAAQPARG